MINANELRIGNWILPNDRDQWNEVYNLRLKQVDIDVLNDLERDRLQNSYSPIPLTPEILESCGFETNINNNPYWFKLHLFDHEFDIYINIHSMTELSYLNQSLKIPLAIRYVHQLQNLYFALTGEELNINLNVEVTI